MHNSPLQIFEESQRQLDHNRLMSLINSLNDGFLAIDNENKIILNNGVALHLLDANTLHGQTISSAMQLLGPDGRPTDPLTVMPDKLAGFTTSDYKIKHSDGSETSLYISVSPVRQVFGKNQTSGYVIVFRNIDKEPGGQDRPKESASELLAPLAEAKNRILNAMALVRGGQSPQVVIEELEGARRQLEALQKP